MVCLYGAHLMTAVRVECTYTAVTDPLAWFIFFFTVKTPERVFTFFVRLELDWQEKFENYLLW